VWWHGGGSGVEGVVLSLPPCHGVIVIVVVVASHGVVVVSMRWWWWQWQ